jgi:dephospho-CoA kinase|uniref:Dephospho-CoA kinase n=1 Tax=candidate division WOR-3 bacterium TaxID=2052148 RepID=A0A7V3PTD9_UNCW3
MFDRQLRQERLLIGIGGNLGAGKTTVANELKRYGAKIIDADSIGKSLLSKGSTEYKKLIQAFGKDILNHQGEIDRKALAKKAFASRAALKKLNSIMHPPLLKKLRQEIARCRQGLVVVDAALLFAWKLHQQMDIAILVTAPDQLRIARMKKCGLSPEDVQQRLKLQGPDTRYWRQADFVLENNGSLAELKRKIRALWNYFYSNRLERLKAKKNSSTTNGAGSR